MRLSIHIILLTALLALTSCASKKVYTTSLAPVRENTSWYMGQEYMSDSVQGVLYDISYENNANNSYCFDVTITNASSRAILVDPAKFYYATFNSRYKPTQDYITYSIAPNNYIERLSANIEETNKKARRNANISIAAEVATFFLGFFLDGYNNTSRDEAAFLTAAAVTATSAISADANYAQLDDMQGEFNYWTQIALLKNTLAPNESIRGKVFFPAPNNEAAFLRLTIPTDSEDLEFVYQLNRQELKR